MKLYTYVLCMFVSLFISVAHAATNDSIRIGYIDEPKKFDILTYDNETASRILYYNVYQGLTYFDEDGKVRPLLATEWQHNPQNTRWLFTIRNNVFFHSGLLLSPSDAAFSLKTIAGLTPDQKGKKFLPAKLIKSVETVGEDQIRIVLKEPYANLPQLLAKYVVVSEHTYKNNYKKPDGTGPFRFDKYVRGHNLVLERNSTYWGKKPKIKYVKWLFFKEDETQIMALKAGNVDVIPHFTIDYKSMVDLNKYNITYGKTQSKVIISFNHRGVLKDVNLRKAITYALSREEINRVVNENKGDIIGSYYTKAQPYYQDLSHVNDNDLQKAQHYIKKVKPAVTELDISVPPFDYARKIADIVAHRLKAININVHINRVSFPLWLRNVYKQHRYDMSVIMHTTGYDIDHLANKNYYWGYDNPYIGKLIDHWYKTGDKKSIIEMQKIIAKDSVHAFLYTSPYIVVYNRHIKHLPIHSYNKQFILDEVEWK